MISMISKTSNLSYDFVVDRTTIFFDKGQKKKGQRIDVVEEQVVSNAHLHDWRDREETPSKSLNKVSLF